MVELNEALWAYVDTNGAKINDLGGFGLGAYGKGPYGGPRPMEYPQVYALADGRTAA